MSDGKTIGVLALGRPTFDVPFAEEMAAKAFATLDATPHRIVGSRGLLFDTEATEEALEALGNQSLDMVLILQVTFTDASMTVAIANRFDTPLAIWSFPEPRVGGRLRLNSFCGLNLAGHALGLNQHPFSYLYAAPGPDAAEAVEELLAGGRQAGDAAVTRPNVAPDAQAKADAVVATLRGAKIGRLGDHPGGFDTCGYDPDAVRDLAGVTVEAMPLDTLFDKAQAVSEDAVQQTRTLAERDVGGLDSVDQDQLDKSLRLKNALDEIRSEGGYAAFAIRCWPETFTEYGGAVCGPVSMMGEKRVPCACEADIYGAMTSLILQGIADAPTFQVDLVDIDTEDDSCIVWHCGQAPISMADREAEAEEATATIHTNRKMPLLYEFALKPGTVTFARLSQSRGEPKLVIARGEMLRRPKAFTGTSGAVRFDAGADRVLKSLMDGGLEHHTGLVYGDFVEELKGVAKALGVPVLEIA
ncbi:MAG: L-fucose/L-arabinose isomerase family protein [Alphaproteobacteria bacterium]|nr:L-fucose/L-arabinose isomerase family protein [Alphaproteobacteria bacterium]